MRPRRYPRRPISTTNPYRWGHGDSLNGIHAMACGTGMKIFGERRQCQMSCRCWCHGNHFTRSTANERKP